VNLARPDGFHESNWETHTSARFQTAPTEMNAKE
jgi:hypothetical protein